MNLALISPSFKVFDSCIELAVARHMFGMLNVRLDQIQRFCEKTGQSPCPNHSRLVFRAMASAPSASAAVLPEGEMEVDYDPADPADEEWQIVQAEQEAQELADAQADFLSNSLKECDKDSLDEKMRVQMEDPQKTIGRLQLGAEATEKAEAWSKSLDGQTQDDTPGVESTPASKPMAGFVSATSTHRMPQPIRFQPDPENHAFSKLVMFPESFPSIPNYLVNMLLGTDEAELTELFSKFMDVPLSGPAVARILEAYVPMKSMCDQEAVWGLSYTKGTTGLGSKPLRARDTATKLAHAPPIDDLYGLRVDHGGHRGHFRALAHSR